MARIGRDLNLTKLAHLFQGLMLRLQKSPPPPPPKKQIIMVSAPYEISLILCFITLQEHFESLNLSLPELIDGQLWLIPVITIINFAVSFCF